MTNPANPSTTGDAHGSRVNRDPAVEAAQRAWDGWDWSDGQSVNVLVEAAAREAIKPIRERHYPVDYINRQRVCVSCWDCHGKPKLWPCDIAPLIYTTEELGQ